MRLLWEEIAARTGARLVVASLPLPAADAEQLLKAVWSAVTPRTRVLFFSHVTSETALVLPVEELCRRAREEGLLSIVDGAHAPGQIPLALDDLGADCYAGNGHKWLCAPKGSAFLYAGDALRGELRPPVVSWGWNDGYQERFGWGGQTIRQPFSLCPPPSTTRLRTTGLQCETAVVSSPAGRSATSSSAWAASRSRRRIFRPRRWSRSRWLTTVPASLQRELRDRHAIEIPVHEVEGRTLVRLSVQGYTTDKDCARLVEALSACIQGSRRSGRSPGRRPSHAAERRRS